MASRLLNIAFPTKGINRRFAFQWQRPFYTDDALNVVPGDALLYRDRGGVRPGMTKLSANGWGSRFTSLGIFTASNGVRSLVGSTATGGASYATIAGGTASAAGGFSTGGRIQCTQFLNGVYFVGDTSLSYPYIVSYDAAGAVTGGAQAVFTDMPTPALPASYPVAIASKYNRMVYAWHGDSAGTAGRPSRIYFSRVNDPLDLDNTIAATDLSAAYSAEINDTNEQITAIIPWFGNYLLIATGTSMYVLDGDPRAGGTIRRCSDKLGIVDCASWCIGEDDSIVAMSRSGPIMIPPGSSPQPQLILRDSLPGVLSAPDMANYDHVLSYDSRARRVYIFRSKISATADVDHYALDLQEKGWWRFRFGSTNHEPFAAIPLRELTSGRTDILLGCRDGYLRYFDETVATDDGTNLTSYAFLGPFTSGDPRMTAILNELMVSLAVNSGDVTVSVHVGNSAEEAYNAAAKWSRTFSAGRSPTRMPRTRFVACYIKITGTAGSRWVFESAAAGVVSGGRLRV